MKQSGKEEHMSDRVVEPSRWWYAWHDWMPGSPPTLHVSGELSFASPGYRASLKKHNPQEEGEETLVLDLIIEASEDSGDKAETTEDVQEVRYREDTDTQYQNVMILSRTRVTVDTTM
jgi:hypothetical protein